MPDSALTKLGRVTTDTRSKATEVLHALERSTSSRVWTIWGYNPASRPEHSSGRALDFMCDRAAGDWIADYLWTHRVRLRVKWVLWRQRIRSTSPGKPTSWRPMSDRGSATQNHMDHVHVFFNDGYDPPAHTPPKPHLPAPHPAAPQPADHRPVAPPEPRPAEPPVLEASRPWWGNRPHPQEPAYLSIGNLRAAMAHDAPATGQELGWYADQVWALQRLLADTGWLRYGRFVAGHYGTYTIGDTTNQDDGGVKGFQRKRGWTTQPDGWVGRRELQWLIDTCRRRYEVRD